MHTFTFQSKKKQEEAREALEAKISETQKSRMLRDENLQLNECDMCKGRHITANCSLKCDTNGPALLLPKAWEMLEPPKAIPLQQPDAESKTSDCKKKCRNKSKKKKKSRKKRNQLVDARKKAQTQQKRNAKCKKTLYQRFLLDLISNGPQKTIQHFPNKCWTRLIDAPSNDQAE